MSLALLRHGHRIHYVPSAHAYTLAPASLRSLLAQRRRWIWGNIQCIRKHLGCAWDGSPIALKLLGGPKLFIFSSDVFWPLRVDGGLHSTRNTLA